MRDEYTLPLGEFERIIMKLKGWRYDRIKKHVDELRKYINEGNSKEEKDVRFNLEYRPFKGAHLRISG